PHFGSIAGVFQLVMDRRRRALLCGACEEHAVAAAAARDALACLQLDLGGPAVDLHLVYDSQGLGLAVDAAIELPRLAQRHRRLSCGSDLDLAVDEAHDLVSLSRAAPEVGAAHAGRHLRGADRDFALARLRYDVGGKAKGAFQHVERRLEKLARGRELGEGELAVLAEPDEAAFG